MPDRRLLPVALRLATILWVVSLLAPSSLQAQAEGGSAAGGLLMGSVGAYSGATLGLVSSLIPCSYLRDGTQCARIATITGGVIGGAAGAVIGARDSDLSSDRVGSIMWGLGIGAGVGWALKGVVRHYGFMDAGAGALLGGAIGAAPKGAAIGFAAGAATGTLLWAIFPQVEVGDAVGLGMLGLAVGGLTQWVYQASQTGSGEPGPTPVPLFTLRF